MELGGHPEMFYPVHAAGWTRQRCWEYLFELFGVWWPKSLCAECPYVSKTEWHEQLSRMLAEPQSTARHLVDEFVALAFNPRSGLFGTDDTLADRLRASGATSVLEAAERDIHTVGWAMYRVRRVYFAPGVAWRSVDTVHRGTPHQTEQVLRWLAREMRRAAETDKRGHTRLWLARRPSGSTNYPQVECFFTIAPAHVADKQRAGFEKHWVTHASDTLQDLDLAAADRLHHRSDAVTAAP